MLFRSSMSSLEIRSMKWLNFWLWNDNHPPISTLNGLPATSRDNRPPISWWVKASLLIGADSFGCNYALFCCNYAIASYFPKDLSSSSKDLSLAKGRIQHHVNLWSRVVSPRTKPTRSFGTTRNRLSVGSSWIANQEVWSRSTKIWAAQE